jgi:ABC-type transport system substrate-binding protein
MAAMGVMSACRRDPPPLPTTRDASITVAIPSASATIGPLMNSLTQTRLVRVDQVGQVQPALVERWVASRDHRTWTLTIRAGVRTHDGTLATAEDVVARVRNALRDPTRGPGLWHVTAVDATSSHEVRIRLSEPSSLLFETLSLVEALPAGPFMETETDADGDTTADIEADEPDLRAVVAPGEDAPAIRTIRIRRFETPRAAVAALLRDEVDVLYEVPTETRAPLESDGDVHLFPHLKPYVMTLGLNHRHPILRRRDVRLAMNAAIDREALISQVAGGVGVPAADMLWHQHWSRPHGGDAALLRVDKVRAGQLLDEGGLRRRTTPDGAVEARFRVACLVLDAPLALRVAGRVQQAYADIGITLDLEAVALPDLVARLQRGQFDAYVSPVAGGFGMGRPYVDLGTHDHPRLTDHGYTAAATAAERVRAATTDEMLSRAIHDLHRVLIEDPPGVSLFWEETARAVGRRVEVPADSTGDVLGTLSRWRLRDRAP